MQNTSWRKTTIYSLNTNLKEKEIKVMLFGGCVKPADDTHQFEDFFITSD